MRPDLHHRHPRHPRPGAHAADLSSAGRCSSTAWPPWWATRSTSTSTPLSPVCAPSVYFRRLHDRNFPGAILAVPAGQLEAGHAYGMSRLQVFYRILLPQMVRHAIPGFGNNWLVLVKTTALVSIIGLDDMVRKGGPGGRRHPTALYLLLRGGAVVSGHHHRFRIPCWAGWKTATAWASAGCKRWTSASSWKISGSTWRGRRSPSSWCPSPCCWG
jgi:hypothetical protein